jgi:hypothetical protein
MPRPIPVHKNNADRAIYLLGFLFAFSIATTIIYPNLFFNLFINYGITISFVLINIGLIAATASDWAEIATTKKRRRKKITTYRIFKLTITILFNLGTYFILTLWKNYPVKTFGDYIIWEYIIGGLAVVIILALTDIIVELEFQARIPSGWNKVGKRNVK